MANFVLNRDYTLRSLSGLSVRFVKGEPVFVPQPLEKEAVAIGATCIDGEIDVLGEPVEEVVEPAGEERTLKLFDAFKTLSERNDREDFTAQGMPATRAVQALVGFKPDRAEISLAWDEYRA